MSWSTIAFAAALATVAPGAMTGEGVTDSQPYRAPSVAEEQAAVDWIAVHGHELSGAQPFPTELAPIVERLKGAKIIGLGEATHGTHEDQAIKAALIEALIRAGAIDTVAVEANRSALAGLNRYARTGAGDLTNLLKSDGFFRIWRDDEFAGLVEWIHDWNQRAAVPVRLVGIDVQDGQRDAAEAAAYVASVDPVAAARIEGGFAPMPTAAPGHRPSNFMEWSMNAPAAQFARAKAAVLDLNAWFNAHAARLGSDLAFRDAQDAARGAQQGFDVATPVNRDGASKFSQEGPALRDRFMAENILALANGNHQTVLWAHNQHVLSDEPVEWRKDFTSLGMRVKDAIGPAYRTVGVSWSRATVLATVKTPAKAGAYFPEVLDRPVPLSNGGPFTVGAEFDRAAPSTAAAMWIDLDEAQQSPTLAGWRNRTLYKGEAGWVVEPDKWEAAPVADEATPVGMGFDLLVWFRCLTPSHRWKGEFTS